MGLSGGGEGVTPVVLGRGMRGLAERAGRGGADGGAEGGLSNPAAVGWPWGRVEVKVPFLLISGRSQLAGCV